MLDGATALALPTKQGQELIVDIDACYGHNLHWKSLNEEGACWFEAIFELNNLEISTTSDKDIARRLWRMLNYAREQNPHFLEEGAGMQAQTRLHFPKEWGLGSSSTLIYTLAQWAKINPFDLLANTMGGSGYDVACAGENSAILYTKTTPYPTVEVLDFVPSFYQNLYFVYLGKKQNSRDGIAHYRSKVRRAPELITEITCLTNAFHRATQLSDWEKLIVEHEQIISKTLEYKRAKTMYFNDYWGAIKSLGAWGGDFVLATSSESEADTKAYFNKKGFDVCLNYDAIICF